MEIAFSETGKWYFRVENAFFETGKWYFHVEIAFFETGTGFFHAEIAFCLLHKKERGGIKRCTLFLEDSTVNSIVYQNLLRSGSYSNPTIFNLLRISAFSTFMSSQRASNVG